MQSYVKNHFSSRPHKTVVLRYEDEDIEIDEALVPLIQEIWKADIATMMSCQETESGIAWIKFDSMDDFLRFLNIVAKYQEGANTLYNRINYQLTGDISKPLWEYNITLHDIESAAEERRQVGGIVDFDVTVGLYFPREDMSIIFERIQAHNQVSPSVAGSILETR